MMLNWDAGLRTFQHATGTIGQFPKCAALWSKHPGSGNEKNYGTGRDEVVFPRHFSDGTRRENVTEISTLFAILLCQRIA
ncbi:hypothetical protein KSD_28420 [Ktedonobacter sp. SOSP1-85]|nr:hypothetical protein KSD_28420 [Ktedonobacter sp. SOSP1-85]